MHILSETILEKENILRGAEKGAWGKKRLEPLNYTTICRNSCAAYTKADKASQERRQIADKNAVHCTRTVTGLQCS